MRTRIVPVGLLSFLVTACLACQHGGSGLDGCLYWMDEPARQWPAEEWGRQVEYMRRAGFRHVIMSGPSHDVLTEAADARLVPFDHFMNAIRGTGLRVYLSLWSHPQWYGRWDLAEELDTNASVIARLTERYGHHPNFAGWYIPHEIYVMWNDRARYMRELYAGLSRMCKAATADKLVVLSPFFILDRKGYLGDFRFAEPDEYENFWADLLAATQIDVVALQDSGEHLSCYTLDDRRPFLAAMRRACTRTGRRLWVNIETGELHVDSLEAYAHRFGRKTHVNDPRTQSHWRAVPPDKLRDKIRLAHEFSRTTITWGYQQYWDPMRGAEPRGVYDAYRGREPARAGLEPQPRPR